MLSCTYLGCTKICKWVFLACGGDYGFEDLEGKEVGLLRDMEHDENEEGEESLEDKLGREEWQKFLAEMEPDVNNFW